MATKESFDNLHNKVRRYAVKIRVGLTVGTRSRSTVAAGIILLKEKNFCYIVAHKKTFSGYLLGTEPCYEVVFPDSSRTTVKFQVKDVQQSNLLAGFFISNVDLENDTVQAVPFSLFEAIAEEAVYTLCVERTGKSTSLSPGLVNVVAGMQFTHDCRPEDLTSWGSPVFNEEGDLVGICISHRSVLLACDVKGIAAILSQMHGSSQKSIHAILEYIKNKGEAITGVH